jgi:hypothetical protein
MSEIIRRVRVLGPVVACALAACGEGLTLPPASLPVTEDTVTLYALSGTPVNTPSAYSLLSLIAVRTDQTTDLDFAFEIGPANRLGVATTGDTVAVLMPRARLGFSPDGGFQATTLPFDSIRLAPERGYDEERAVRADSGAVYLVTSRRQSCNFGFVRPYYAKLRVEALDRVQRTVRLRLVIDPNCGYRSFEPGIPQE